MYNPYVGTVFCGGTPHEQEFYGNLWVAVPVEVHMPDLGRIPGPLVIPNTVQIRLLWQLGNLKLATNVMYGDKNAPLVVNAALCDDINGSLTTDPAFATWMALVSHANSYLGIGCKDISDKNFPEFRSTNDPSPGTHTGTSLPPEVAFVVSSKTNFSGQAFRGRTYLPGIAAAETNADGSATTAVVSAALAFVEAWFNAIDSNGLTPGLGHPARASYMSPDTGRTIPARDAGTVPIVDFVVRDNVYDSQRRRSEP